MIEWQPISTAPKDGTIVRLRFGNDEADEYGPFEGSWIDGEWWDRIGSDYAYGAAEPTHWMLIPAAE